MSRSAVAAASIVAAFLSVAARAQVDQPTRYRIVDLGTLSPTGAGFSNGYSVSNISNTLSFPVVVGTASGVPSTTPSGLPFVWTPESGMYEGTAGLARSGAANGVNEDGFYTGTMSVMINNVLETRGFFAGLFIDAVILLPGTGGATGGNGINDNRDIAGYAVGQDGAKRAVVWSATAPGPIDLGTLGGRTSEAFAINNQRFVVGASSNSRGVERAFFVGPVGNLTPPMQDLGGLFNAGWAVARDLNDANIVVGQAQLPPLSPNVLTLGFRAVRWARVSSNTAWNILNLGTLANTDNASEALGVNRHGQIVGWSGSTRTGPFNTPTRRQAFIWQDGRMQNLNNLVLEGGGWNLEVASEINDQGYITGWGTRRLSVDSRLPQPRAFLLIPTRN